MSEHPDVMRQEAPYPVVLAELVERCRYRPHWLISLADVDRGQGSKGLTLIVTTQGFDSYHPDRGETYRVKHYFPVPPAAYNEQSWRRWLFEQLRAVESHEAAEFFALVPDGSGYPAGYGERPYAPHHGPGHDPYIIFEHGSDLDRRTRYTGEINQ